jgi:hypothetical protein
VAVQAGDREEFLVLTISTSSTEHAYFHNKNALIRIIFGVIFLSSEERSSRRRE